MFEYKRVDSGSCNDDGSCQCDCPLEAVDGQCEMTDGEDWDLYAFDKIKPSKYDHSFQNFDNNEFVQCSKMWNGKNVFSTTACLKASIKFVLEVLNVFLDLMVLRILLTKVIVMN